MFLLLLLLPETPQLTVTRGEATLNGSVGVDPAAPPPGNAAGLQLPAHRLSTGAEMHLWY